MAYKNEYLKQVDLLIETLAYIDWNGCFALKGGTAINLFFNDMPRLSVDIDLVYTPIKIREQSILEINAALNQIATKLEKAGYQTKMVQTVDKQYQKINVMNRDAVVVIEPNYIIRGSILPLIKTNLAPSAVEHFKKNSAVRCMSYHEVYAGKMVAFLDRQHPRDLFDMAEYYEKERTLSGLLDALIVYMAQSNRPFSELLNPNLQSNEQDYLKSFSGMTFIPVDYSSLLASRDTVLDSLKSNLAKRHIEFLTSFMEKAPDWSKLPLGDISHLPAIQWKLKNIDKMDNDKRKLEIEKINNAMTI